MKKFGYFLLWILLFDLQIIYAQPSALMEFKDQDPRGGWLSGRLIISLDKDLNVKFKKDQELFVYWGNNPNQKVAMLRPLATFSYSNKGKDVHLNLKSVQVPVSATHFLLFSKSLIKEKTNNSQKTKKTRERQLTSLLLMDQGVPTEKVQSIRFDQSDREANHIKGSIELQRAWDERNITHYAVYWGISKNTVLRTQPAIQVIEKRSWIGSLGMQLFTPWQDIPLSIELDDDLPPEATHLIVFTRNSEGQMSEGISVPLKKFNQVNEANFVLTFQQNPAEKGIISGSLKLKISNIALANQQEEIQHEPEENHYLFFWGQDKKTRLGVYPAFAQVEIKNSKEGLVGNEIQVSTLTQMDQELLIKPINDSEREINFVFPDETSIPDQATHILVFTQQKFWFQEDADRKLLGPIAFYKMNESNSKPEAIIEKQLENLPKPEKGYKNSEWRISEYRGIGFGVSLAGLNGIALFYDHNIENDRQWHFNLDHTGPQAGVWYKTLRLTNEDSDMNSVAESSSGNKLEISRTLFSGTYRWFLDQSEVWGITDGFYYGIGAGLGYATFKYDGQESLGTSTLSEDSETFNSTITEYKHSTVGYGMFGVLDFGWQGLKNYFMHVSLQPSLYLYYQDGYQSSKIPVTPNQRSTADDLWSQAKSLSRLFVGFGIFF